MRVAAVWFPDWPVQAARLEADDQLEEPLAIGAQHRIKVVSHRARALGVHRGMKVRHAQSVCPELTVVDDNPDRDGRMFTALAAGFDDVAASVEVLRPGLVIVDAAAAGSFHGSEEKATEMLIDAAARRGIDAFAGVADEIATALIAARSSAIVPAGTSADFLARQPLNVLLAETSLGADTETVKALGQLGVATLGELAQLPSTAVSTRFGNAGMACHRIARAAPDRRVAPELPAADLSVAVTPEDPIDRVDSAAFAARALAASLHERLAEAGQNCLRLKVKAELSDGTVVERTWRTREALTEEATADRVRWQLDGWLTSGGAGTITSLILEPLELAQPDPVGQLWGTGGGSNNSNNGEARRVAERVQSALGIDAVLQPRFVGGRGVAERIALIPFGERDPESADGKDPAGASWPGAIPPPLPARIGGGVDHPASRIVMIDDAARPVGVTAEALLSTTPYALSWGGNHYLVTGWAGPWPVDEGWWGENPQKVARLQVVGTREEGGSPLAWLLLWTKQTWRVEAMYS
ncbi:Y-family DNA polymerase [Corynebacterium urinipleomorphum]|uniref:Y-family DNA polymerase n=1 Tax=Corynebacterium urinipleomorphum TaxID=1852380 RepID=UPI000B35FD88|nr:DNA polymerase Y family protein [Corynebacterium urinipleomorphum]